MKYEVNLKVTVDGARNHAQALGAVSARVYKQESDLLLRGVEFYIEEASVKEARKKGGR